MSVTINGSTLKNMPFNQYSVKKWFHNGILVWQRIVTGYVSYSVSSNTGIISTSLTSKNVPGTISASNDIEDVLSVNPSYQMVTILEDIYSLSIYCQTRVNAMDAAVGGALWVSWNGSNAGYICYETFSGHNNIRSKTITLNNLKKGDTVSIQCTGGTTAARIYFIGTCSTFTWNA